MRIALCKTDEVGDGEVRRVDVDARRSIAVFKIDGDYYGTDDRCTHGEASLSEGFVDGNIIECPLHGGAFDIKTGLRTDKPCVTPIATYTLSIDGDTLFADIDG